MNREECRKLTELDKSYITERMVCAGEGGKDVCNGDSGGPLLVNSKVFGVVSFGVDGCGKGEPGIFASIPATREWIARQVLEIKGLVEPVSCIP